MTLLKYVDYYPYHVRRFLESKDHRYLYFFDYNSNPYKMFDEVTKKSVY